MTSTAECDRADYADQTVGSLIRARRLALGWTQETLAGHIGYSTRELRYWEHDRISPTVNTLLALARALGVAPAALIPGGDTSCRICNGTPTRRVRLSHLRHQRNARPAERRHPGGRVNQQLALGELPPGRHERNLEHRRELTRSTITPADRAHARHADQCPICEDNARSFHALLGVLDRTEEARRTFVLGLRQMIGDRSVPSTWTTSAKKLAAAADREWRNASTWAGSTRCAACGTPSTSAATPRTAPIWRSVPT